MPGDAKLADSSAFDWHAISFPFDNKIIQAVLLDSVNGWVLSADESRQLYRLQNGNWRVELSPPDIGIVTLLGFFDDNLWFACFNKKNYRYFLRQNNEKYYRDYYPPNADPISQLDFLAPDNIWAVCQWGQIMRFDGTSWKSVPCPTFTHVTSISMANDSCGWAAGKYRGTGYLLHWNGKKWQIKMRQKNIVPNVIMVNDSLGYAFREDDSWIIRLTHDRWELLTLASIIKDTVIVTWQDMARPLFFNNNGVVTMNTNSSHITYENRHQDILWFTRSPEKPQTKIYLLTHDGAVKNVRRQLPITPKANWQYIGNALQFATQEYGVAFGDIDSDGDDDIYSINTADKNRLLLFNGNRQVKSKVKDDFIDGAEHLNLLGTTRSREGETIYDMGATLADVDNDGDRDLYITSMYEKNMLYENIKNQTFRDIAVKAAVSCGTARSQVGIWGDVDNDGDVDLFVTNEDTTNMLFLNNGFGKFREITHLAGLTSRRGGKGATFGDLDGDGDLDLVVPNFNIRNRIYRNEGINSKTGLPFFRDATDIWLQPGLDTLAKSTAACVVDFDNDGDLDLFICNLVLSNRLYENDGSGHFTDITESAGLFDSSLTSSACFFDADNDGDLDLFLSNRGPNLFFKNLGNKKFVRDEKTFIMEPTCYSNGVACGDPDRDGDIDLYVANNDSESTYYQNNLNNNNFLEIKLIGTTSNRDAIGAKAFLYEAGHLNDRNHLLGLREVNGGYGYGCMNSTTIHFGIHPDKRYDLEIWFPSRIILERTDLTPGQFLIIEEQTGWAKSLAFLKIDIMRLVKSQRNQIELLKFVGLLIILIASLLLMNKKKWIAVRSPFYLLIYPLLLYIILIVITSDHKFWLAFLLPMLIAIVTFVGLVLLEKQKVAQTTRDRLAEELLISCKAFDHGSWATSYLNQLQLFSVNIPANQPISEKIGDQLHETIRGFYEVVYKEIGHIHQLAQDASIQVQQASELDRQRLFLSENLEKIKVALVLNKNLPSETWQNVNRLVDQIKMSVRDINYSVARLFACDAIAIIQQILSASKNEGTNHLLLATPDMQNQPLWVCIKPNELAAIIDNLLQNARRAMSQQPNPKITIKFSQNDRYSFVEFSDNGCGIPKKLWDQIFEESYTTKSDDKGGFGLYYSRRTLEKYGGSIEVARSAKDRGTTFLMKLRRV